MENSNLNQVNERSSDLPFVDHFSKLRENPKWIVKLIVLSVLTFISIFLTNYITDYTEILKNAGLSQEEIDKENSMNISGLIAQSLGTVLIGTLFVFLIFLIVSKIMKSDARAIHIFSATLSYSIIITAFSIIVYGIQALFGLTLPDTVIDSLNIFDRGNQYLAAFNFTGLLSSYLVFAVYYGTSKLSKKASIIWAIVEFVVSTGFALLIAAFMIYMQSFN